MLMGTCVFPSSGHVIKTSAVSPTDLPLIFKNRYSISKVARESTLIPLVRIQFPITSFTADAICLGSSLSIAMISIFSSLTRNGLYLIFFFNEGISNSYVGVDTFGKGIIFYNM